MDACQSESSADTGVRPLRLRNWATVSVCGEVDIAAADDVLATVLAASRADSAGILVDVSAVTFIDAAGIGTFLRARNFERDGGRDLALHAAPLLVTRLLDICGLPDLVEPAFSSDER